MNLQHLIKSTERFHSKNQDYYEKIHGIIYFYEEETVNASLNENKEEIKLFKHTEENHQDKINDFFSFDDNHLLCDNNNYTLTEGFGNIIDGIHNTSLMRFFPKQNSTLNELVMKYNINIVIVENKNTTQYLSMKGNPLLIFYKYDNQYYGISNLSGDIFTSTDYEYQLIAEQTEQKVQEDYHKMSAQKIKQLCEQLNIDLYTEKNGKKKKKTKKELIEDLEKL